MKYVHFTALDVGKEIDLPTNSISYFERRVITIGTINKW